MDKQADRQTDSQTHMKKLIVTFRNFSKAPKNVAGIWLVVILLHDILHVWETKFVWPSEEPTLQGDRQHTAIFPVITAPFIFWLQTGM
jgi:hypothetical protein